MYDPQRCRAHETPAGWRACPAATGVSVGAGGVHLVMGLARNRVPRLRLRRRLEGAGYSCTCRWLQQQRCRCTSHIRSPTILVQCNHIKGSASKAQLFWNVERVAFVHDPMESFSIVAQACTQALDQTLRTFKFEVRYLDDRVSDLSDTM